MIVNSGQIYVSYGQYYLKGSYFDTDEWRPEEGNGLIIALREPGVPAVPGQFAIILTGTHDGQLKITQRNLEKCPSEDNFDQWDEVTEVSLSVDEDDVFGVGTVEEGDEDDEFPDFPSGDCRVRLHARGRSLARTSPDRHIVQEEHLILVWPAPPEPETVLKRFGE